MGSSEPSQPAISTSIPLPQWMKQKMNDRYDIDQPFSPPSQDEAFFYIRYPKSTTSNVQQPEQHQFRPISEVLEKHPDFSKHTPHCRQFIPQANADKVIPEISLTKAKKSLGMDDNFHGESASCGKSVVHVAQQMVAGTFIAKEFNEKTTDSFLSADSYDLSRRRGSKSLPASPISTPQSSPRVAKRSNHNPYFAGTVAPTQDQKYHGWILTGFLGQRDQQLSIPEENKSASKEDLTSTDIEKLDSLQVSPGMRRNKSTSVIGQLVHDSVDSGQTSSKPAIGVKVVRPKPSGLREMNFWSPTSM